VKVGDSIPQNIAQGLMQEALLIQHLASKGVIVFNHEAYPSKDIRNHLIASDPPRAPADETA